VLRADAALAASAHPLYLQETAAMTRIFASALVASGLAFAGAAQADQPFVLGAAELDTVTAAGTVEFTTTIVKDVNITKNVDLIVNKTVTSTVSLVGSLATAEASADAIDFDNVLAETDVFAQVDATGAFSFGEALAAGFNNP
jgi:hypothetical protein